MSAGGEEGRKCQLNWAVIAWKSMSWISWTLIFALVKCLSCTGSDKGVLKTSHWGCWNQIPNIKGLNETFNSVSSPASASFCPGKIQSNSLKTQLQPWVTNAFCCAALWVSGTRGNRAEEAVWLQNNSLYQAKRECAPRANLPLQHELKPRMLQNLEITPKSSISAWWEWKISLMIFWYLPTHPLQNLWSNLSLYLCTRMENGCAVGQALPLPW